MKISLRKELKMHPFYYLVLIFLIPDFLIYRADLEVICDAWHLAQLAFTGYLLFDYIVSKHLNRRIPNLILLYYAWISLSCFANGTTPIAVIWGMTPDIGISLFALKAVERSQSLFVKITAKVLIFYILLNGLIMILFPGGIASGRIGQPIWLLGGKNVIVPYIIVGGVFLVLSSYEREGRNTAAACAVMLLSGITGFFTDSATTVLLVGLMWAGVFVERIIRNKNILDKLFSGRKLVIFVAAIFVFVVFFSANRNITRVITTWLGRDVTFNGRNALWAAALSGMKKHALFGSGPSLILDVGWGVAMTHAHDLFINVAVKHGIPAVAILLLVIVSAFKRTQIAAAPLAYYFLALYLVGSVVEVYSTDTLFLACVTLASFQARGSEGGIGIAAKEQPALEFD